MKKISTKEVNVNGLKYRIFSSVNKDFLHSAVQKIPNKNAVFLYFSFFIRLYYFCEWRFFDCEYQKI